MGRFDNKFESANQEWETPDEIFSPLNDEFDFFLDVCASKDNAKCNNYYSLETDAFKQVWRGNCWMNPPFRELGRWVKKAYEESKHCTVVCLLPCRTNTNWWHDYCLRYGEIRYIRGRPKFNNSKHGLPQPLAIVIFREGAE